MPVTEEAIRRVKSHWALEAFGVPRFDSAINMANEALVHVAIGNQINRPPTVDPNRDELLTLAATAAEVAAVEYFDALNHPSKETQPQASDAQSAAYLAFDLLRSVHPPEGAAERCFFALHLSALGYVAERWPEVRRWIRDNHYEIPPDFVEGGGWDARVLSSIYSCWEALFRKNGLSDLVSVGTAVAKLRREQSEYEPHLLRGGIEGEQVALALRLVALYHWARATEIVATFLAQGGAPGVMAAIDQHFDSAATSAAESGDAAFEMLLRWLHVASKRMVAGSLWYVGQGVSEQATAFIRSLTTASRPLFELLPPQQAAIQEQGLLDQASRAVIVSLPTSGGKTLLAEFRVLQALQFAEERGWVAYVAPTRALVTQLTRRLRSDLGPIGIQVEQLTPAVDLDSFEEELLTGKSGDTEPFQVLVATPEKLDLVIRNRKTDRPLALVVLDEAHNIEEEERGLRIELLLATIKRDCPNANFLLLTPFVPNAEELTRWLAPESGKTISLGTSVWKPNDRVIGLYSLRHEPGAGNWSLDFETVSTQFRTLTVPQPLHVGGVRPLRMNYTKAKSLTAQTGAIASIFSGRGTSMAIASTIPNCWSMARQLSEILPEFDVLDPDVKLVREYLAAEVSPQFELIDMLGRGIGVHNAGLSDEVRTLIEQLAAESKLRVLCATSGISQGIDFPVSSVFLASLNLGSGEQTKQMTSRAFWNLAGRAGRTGQSLLGVVGIAAGDHAPRIRTYIETEQVRLASRLRTMLDDLAAQGRLAELKEVIQEEAWADYRSYIAHLCNSPTGDSVLGNRAEEVLRNTFGFTSLRSGLDDAQAGAKASALLEATVGYAKELSKNPERTRLADQTGFAPEGVTEAISQLASIGRPLTAEDWSAESLFGAAGNSTLPQLVGVMLHVPEIRATLGELAMHGDESSHIAEIARDWVSGVSIDKIAATYFSKNSADSTDSVTRACRGIYRRLASAGTWGLFALASMPNSGLAASSDDVDVMRRVRNLPAMIYYGVNTDAGILMRANNVPRVIATKLGETFWRECESRNITPSFQSARVYIRGLADQDWSGAIPTGARGDGRLYRQVWARLSGEPTPPPADAGIGISSY